MNTCEYINQFNDFVIDTFLSSDKLNANDYVLLCIDTNFINSYIKKYGQSSWDTMIDYLSRNYENVIKYYCNDYIKYKYPGFLWIIAIHIYAAYKINRKGYYHSLTTLLKGDDDYQKYLEKKLPEYTKLLWLTCYKDFLNRYSYKYFLGTETLSMPHFAVRFAKSQLYLNNDDMKMLTNFVHNNIDKLNSNTYTDYVTYMPQSLVNKITNIKDKMFDDYINSFINVLKEDNTSKTPVTPTKPNNTVYNAKSTLYITAYNDEIVFIRNNKEISHTEVFQKQTYRLLEKDKQYDDTWIILDTNSKFREIDEIELYNNTCAICYIGDKAPQEFDIIEQATIYDKEKNISMYILSKDDIELLGNNLFEINEFKLSGGLSVGYRKWLYGAGPIIEFSNKDNNYLNNIEINDNKLAIRKDYFVQQKPGIYTLSILNKTVKFEIVSFDMQDKYDTYNNVGWKVDINEFPCIVEENWLIQGLNIKIDKQQKKEKNKIHQYILEKFGLKYVRE